MQRKENYSLMLSAADTGIEHDEFDEVAIGQEFLESFTVVTRQKFDGNAFRLFLLF